MTGAALWSRTFIHISEAGMSKSSSIDGDAAHTDTPMELVRDLVYENPGLTVRELLAIGRKTGLALGKREMNSMLYKLRGLRVVDCVSGQSGAAPIWLPHSGGPIVSEVRESPSRRGGHRSTSDRRGTISEGRVSTFQQLVMKGGETVSVGIVTESANDAYATIDVLDKRIVVALNAAHPICSLLAHTDESFNLLIAMAIVDAVTQTRMNRSIRERSEYNLIELRDAALREFALISDQLTIRREAP